ncbi:MAG TPA: hypothetical protein VHB70_11070 [Parafilimonas sp.]|nr:hypothetical protein [Parafilimonas sp.]
MELKQFQNSCLNENNDLVVQKYLVDGPVYFFETYYPNTDEEFNFKKDLSDSLNVHLRDIVIVGSSKLGFSIKPDKTELRLYQYKEFDFNYKNNVESKKSDLDVAIVSNSLFDSQLLNVYNHTLSYTIETYSYYKKKMFAFYILKGWLRPDYLPGKYSITPEINDVQKKYKGKYSRSVNIGIYKSWHFFETYHRNNIHTIQLNLLANG